MAGLAASLSHGELLKVTGTRTSPGDNRVSNFGSGGAILESEIFKSSLVIPLDSLV